VRGIFFDVGAAEAVAARLTLDGYSAQVVIERLAGEDDDEDHPWAVLTDAPEIALELLVDEYDGWLDADDDPSGAAAPGQFALPTEPRRVKRTDGGVGGAD
jgi:hypothetical protein